MDNNTLNYQLVSGSIRPQESIIKIEEYVYIFIQPLILYFYLLSSGI